MMRLNGHGETTADIMAEFKNKKFVVVSEPLLDKDEYLVILTDIPYWADHEKELDNWCNQNGVTLQGMCLAFPNPKTMTLFTLKWS